MIENGEAHHARVFDGSAHQLVILDASPIIGDRDDTGLPKRTDRRQFLAHQAFRNRAGGQHVDARHFGRAILDPGDGARTVRDGRRIRHADDGGESTRRRRPRAGLDRLLPAEPGLSKMDVEIDQPRADDEIAGINLIRLRVRELRVERGSELGRQRSERSAISSRLFAGSMIRPLRMIVFMALRFLRRDKGPPSGSRGRW